METDEPTVPATRSTNLEATSLATVSNELRETISTPPLSERSGIDLPEVTPGSEAWHAHFPTQWLPVITRDIELQRNDKVSPHIKLPTDHSVHFLMALSMAELKFLIVKFFYSALKSPSRTHTSPA